MSISKKQSKDFENILKVTEHFTGWTNENLEE